MYGQRKPVILPLAQAAAATALVLQQTGGWEKQRCSPGTSNAITPCIAYRAVEGKLRGAQISWLCSTRQWCPSLPRILSLFGEFPAIANPISFKFGTNSMSQSHNIKVIARIRPCSDLDAGETGSLLHCASAYDIHVQDRDQTYVP